MAKARSRELSCFIITFLSLFIIKHGPSFVSLILDEFVALTVAFNSPNPSIDSGILICFWSDVISNFAPCASENSSSLVERSKCLAC